jgi:hypothetical protein
MVPTLRDGDRVVVRHGAPIRPGDVVLASYPTMPGRLVLKRAVRPVADGWWLASDNAAAGGGSDRHGAGAVHGRVVLRIEGRRVRRVRRVQRVRRPPRTPNGPAA